MKTEHLREFLIESNKIEGIKVLKVSQVNMAHAFLRLELIKVHHMENLVGSFQPGAILRDKPGMDVRVGNYRPARGGPNVVSQLELLLQMVGSPKPEMAWDNPYKIHKWYESLHPFGDGNGRSGRMLWLWQMVNQGHGYRPEWGFLQHFYFQSLEHGR